MVFIGFVLVLWLVGFGLSIAIPGHLQSVFSLPRDEVNHNEKVSSHHKKGGHHKKVFTQYSSIEGYFKQSDDNTDDEKFSIIDDFGLETHLTWNNVLEDLQKLNKKHKKQYKLFFLARHGEAWHNVAEEYYKSREWTCDWQMKDGNGTVEWFDARLTPRGQGQIDALSKTWDQQIHRHNVPIPQSYYVSPLTRTLQTFELTWSPLIDVFSSKPRVVELARETYGIGTESKRHNTTYIDLSFPFVTFESGFAFDDNLWTPTEHESHQHRNYRAHLLLNEIFSSDDNQVISITSHSGLISSILKVIGHRKWALKTGQMIPVIIEASKPGHYKTPTLDRPWSDLRQCEHEKSVESSR